eukprot:PhM_4_TR1232/c0_g1_i1/m.76873
MSSTNEEQREKQRTEKRSARAQITRDGRDDEEIDMCDIPKEMPRASADVLAKRKILRARRPAGAGGGAAAPAEAAPPAPTTPEKPNEAVVMSPSKTVLSPPPPPPAPAANPFAAFASASTLSSTASTWGTATTTASSTDDSNKKDSGCVQSPRPSSDVVVSENNTGATTPETPKAIEEKPEVRAIEAPKPFAFSFGSATSFGATAAKSDEPKASTETKSTTDAGPFKFSFAQASTPTWAATSSWAPKTTETSAGEGETKEGADDGVVEGADVAPFDPAGSIIPDPQREALQKSAVGEQRTGEENENTEYSCEVRVYVAHPQTSEWGDLGRGELRLNCDRDDNVSSRLLFRDNKTKRLLINCPLGKSFSLNAMKSESAGFLFTAMLLESEASKTYTTKTYLIRLPKDGKTGTLQALHDTISRYDSTMKEAKR